MYICCLCFSSLFNPPPSPSYSHPHSPFIELYSGVGGWGGGGGLIFIERSACDTMRMRYERCYCCPYSGISPTIGCGDAGVAVGVGGGGVGGGGGGDRGWGGRISVAWRLC